jgi:CRP-like cAMP-binding protein
MSDALRIIKSKSAAIRTDSDLDLIRTTFDADLSGADVVWASLSNRQKNCLCKHFEFRAALSDGGDFYPCVEKTGVDSLKSHPVGLFVLLRGEAMVSIGNHSISLRGGDGVRAKRVILGRLAIPEDALDFFFVRSGRAANNTYHEFVSLERECEEVSLRFSKGASYCFLPESRSRVFIERLNASLLTRRILRDIGISELMHQKPTMSDKEMPEITQFRPGDVLLKEGTVANRVLFVAKGSCVIFRKPKRGVPPMCVGSLTSPSFIGFSPLLLANENRIGHCFGIHPVSVVAVTTGYVFSFSSKQFLIEIKHSKSSVDLVAAFKHLALVQQIWIDAAKELCANDETEELEVIVKEEKVNPLRSTQNQTEENKEDEIAKLISNIGKGKLRRTKVLSTLHESLTSDNNSLALDSSRLDHPLLQSISKNLLKEIMANLEKDGGVIFGCNESGDPFHNFSIESNDYDMALMMPTPVLDRLGSMAHNFLGLGRKRPPKYDESDPFLLPVPSAVDRKMHGKTLPIIRRAKGSIDPVNYNEKEWV